MATIKDAGDENRADMLENLNKLRIKKHYCDITVIVEGDMQYPCHRAVLAAVSEYFHSLFTSDLWKESSTETTLKQVSAQTFEIILNYAYTGILNINPENAFVLLKTGDFLRMPKFLERCMEYVRKTPHVLNVLDIFLYAIHPMKKVDFATSVAKGMAPRFEEVMKTSEFLNMSFNALKLMMVQIPVIDASANCSSCNHSWQTYHSRQANNTYNCSTCGRCCPARVDTTSILHYLVKWMNYDLIQRKKHFREIAVYVKVPKELVDNWESMLDELEDQCFSKIVEGDSKAALTRSCENL